GGERVPEEAGGRGLLEEGLPQDQVAGPAGDQHHPRPPQLAAVADPGWHLARLDLPDGPLAEWELLQPRLRRRGRAPGPGPARPAPAPPAPGPPAAARRSRGGSPAPRGGPPPRSRPPRCGRRARPSRASATAAARGRSAGRGRAG